MRKPPGPRLLTLTRLMAISALAFGALKFIAHDNSIPADEVKAEKANLYLKTLHSTAEQLRGKIEAGIPTVSQCGKLYEQRFAPLSLYKSYTGASAKAAGTHIRSPEDYQRDNDALRISDQARAYSSQLLETCQATYGERAYQ